MFKIVIGVPTAGKTTAIGLAHKRGIRVADTDWLLFAPQYKKFMQSNKGRFMHGTKSVKRLYNAMTNLSFWFAFSFLRLDAEIQEIKTGHVELMLFTNLHNWLTDKFLSLIGLNSKDVRFFYRDPFDMLRIMKARNGQANVSPSTAFNWSEGWKRVSDRYDSLLLSSDQFMADYLFRYSMEDLKLAPQHAEFAREDFLRRTCRLHKKFQPNWII